MDGPTPRTSRRSARATFTVEAVQERERITDHDVAAFVDVLAASAGQAGRWIHFGLTSSDVLDTALALQLRAAGEIVLAARASSSSARRAGARARRHGLRRAHPRRARRADDVRHQARRLRVRGAPQRRAAASARSRRPRVGASRGAVGTYSRDLARSSRRACSARLGLRAEPVSTQVVPRDRHAELLQAIALAGAGLERLATEIRHLQRTEVREVEEPFRAGEQKGSSAMPHKRNPITTERITGLARVLRGYAQAGVENVALWHERDISHSGAERVILPDATILLDYMQSLALRVVAGMVVHADRMRANLDLTHGALFSQRVLLALVAAGMQRDDAYRIVQEAAQRAWDTRHAAARAARRARRSASTSTRSSTSRTTRATRARSSAGWTRSRPRASPSARLTQRRAGGE